MMPLAKVYAELPIKESVSLSSLIEEAHYIYDWLNSSKLFAHRTSKIHRNLINNFFSALLKNIKINNHSEIKGNRHGSNKHIAKFIIIIEHLLSTSDGII